MAERQGLEPWTPLLVQLFSRQCPRPAGRVPLVGKWCSREDLHLEPPPSQGGVQDSYTSGADEMVAVSGIAPDSFPLQGNANLSQLHSHGSPAWTCTTTTRLTAGHAALTSPGSSKNGPSARYCAAVSHLSSGCSPIELRRK